METPSETSELESSLPSLVKKLRELAETLNSQERKVFKEIVDSAAYHAAEIGSHDMGMTGIANAKPMSVHATASMRAQYANLASELSLDE